jgi:integrase
MVRGRRVRRSFATREEAIAFESAPEHRELETLDGLLKAVARRRWAGTANEVNATRNAQDVIDILGGSLHPREVDERRLDLVVETLRARGNSPATINRKLAAISVLLRHALKRRVIDRVPVIEREKEPEGRLRWLTRHEADRLLAALSGDARDAVVLLLATGARRGEVLALEWQDVIDDSVRFVSTKNGSSRTVPLTKEARLMLADRRARAHPHDQLVFPNLSPRQLEVRFETARKDAGLGRDVTIHVLRHTVASWLVQRGVPIAAVQRWLGHKTISMTLRYGHLAPENLEDARSALER